MSSNSPTLAIPGRPRPRRAAMFAWAGLFAIGLAIVAPAGADAAPLTSLFSSAAKVSTNGQVTLTASGFVAGEALSFTLDATPLPTYGSASETADAQGQYAGVAVIPTSAALGAHTITVTGTTSPSASTVIDVVAKATSSVSPSTITLSDYLSRGVTATFSGFTPGSTVSFGIYTSAMGDPAGPDQVVGVSGVVTVHYMPTAGTGFAAPGTYGLSTGADSWSVVAQPLSFQVTADPVATAPAPVAPPATPVKIIAHFTG